MNHHRTRTYIYFLLLISRLNSFFFQFKIYKRFFFFSDKKFIRINLKYNLKKNTVIMGRGTGNAGCSKILLVILNGFFMVS